MYLSIYFMKPATYFKIGWTIYTTNAEISGQTKMCMICNEAWGMQRGAFRWRVKKNCEVDSWEFRLSVQGGTLTCPILTSGGYGAGIYCQGIKVLTYLGSGYGWACERTPA